MTRRPPEVHYPEKYIFGELAGSPALQASSLLSSLTLVQVDSRIFDFGAYGKTRFPSVFFRAPCTEPDVLGDGVASSCLQCNCKRGLCARRVSSLLSSQIKIRDKENAI